MAMFRTKPVALVVLCGLVAVGCDSLWPRDNRYDPRRCDPACSGGQICVEGLCVAPTDGGVDAADGSPDAADGSPDAADGSPDRGDGPVVDQRLVDGPAVDRGALDRAVADRGRDGYVVPPCKTGWSNMPQGKYMFAVWGRSDSEVYAAGNASTVRRYNGNTWSIIRTATSGSALRAIWGDAAGKATWFVGDRGVILRYDGKAWTDFTSSSKLTGEDLHAVHGGGPSGHVYAVGDKSTVLKYDGKVWTKPTLPGSTVVDFSGVWVSPTGTVHAAGKANSSTGKLWIYKAGKWTGKILGTLEPTAIWGRSDNEVYLVGSDLFSSVPSAIVLTNSVTHAYITGHPGKKKLTGIFGQADGPLFAVGEGGTVLVQTGGVWSDATGYPTTNEHWGVWASPNNLYVVDKFASIRRYRFPWQKVFSLPKTKTATLHGIWGSGATDIHVVGSNETVVHFNGAWTHSQLGSGGITHRDVWGSSKTNVYLVGYKSGSSVIRKRSGSGSWVTEPGGSGTHALRAIWGSSASDIYAVGGDITRCEYFHYTGSWTKTNGVCDDYYGVWGSGPKDVYLVGYVGGGSDISHYSGSWTHRDVGIGTANELRDVWGSSKNNVYLVGKKGTMLRGAASTWAKVTTPVSGTLHAVWGSSASDVFVVGERGTALVGSASSFKQTVVGTTSALRDVWGSSASDVYAVGGDSVYRLCKKP